MGDRDPTVYRLRPAPLMNSNNRLNPAASSYAPGSQPRSSMASQVSASPSPYLEARVLNLEQEHSDLRDNVDLLKDMYHDLVYSVGSLQKQKQDPVEAHQDALKFKQMLEQLSREVHADEGKANTTTTPKANDSLPPHLSTSSGSKSLPPHLRKKTADG
jgi:hypothetical protein